MKQYVTNHPGIRSELLAPVSNPDRLPPRLAPWLPNRLPSRTVLVPCARNGLCLGWRAMGLDRNDRVLVPSFVCDTVSRPLEQAGAHLVFFNVRLDGSIDWDHVRSLLGRKVKAMLWYHFLGLSVGFDEVIRFCREHGLYLIEDCAHALFSRYRGRPVGGCGDLSVFSIHKTLPTPRAGALVVHNPRFAMPPPATLEALATPAAGAKADLIRELEIDLHRLHLQSLDYARPVVRESPQYLGRRIARLYADARRVHHLDDTSMLVMHNTDPSPVRRARHRNFKLYLEPLGQIALFKRITPGAAPIGFPIVVRRRDAFRKRLRAEGVESLVHWPTWLLPRGVARKFPDTRKLAESILSLPCHHDLGPEQIAYAARAVCRVL